MKRVSVVVAVMLIALFISAPAYAEGVDPAVAGYDWSYLGTIAGATAAVLLVVQYTKGAIDKLKHIPTRLYVYVLSLAVLLLAQVVTGGIRLADVPLIALNAVVVSTSAMGSYEMTFAKKDNGDV